MRKQGYSVKEIADELEVSKSSVSVWVRNTVLSKSAETKLLKKIRKGQLSGGKMRHEQTKVREREHLAAALNHYKNLELSKEHIRLICALIYWCEGSKNTDRVEFANSDPRLIKLFLDLFRKGFEINEKKFRVCLHPHEYHNSNKQHPFWEHKTNISKKQFIKAYLKPHTGKQIRENYQGCASIRYHDADMARHLHAYAKAAFDLAL